MHRWITFDEESAAFAARYCGTAVHFHRSDALDSLLKSDNPAILIFPSQQRGSLSVVSVRHCSAAEDSPTYKPTGVLGLSDAVVFDDEPVAEKKWWDRLLKRPGQSRR